MAGFESMGQVRKDFGAAPAGFTPHIDEQSYATQAAAPAIESAEQATPSTPMMGQTVAGAQGGQTHEDFNAARGFTAAESGQSSTPKFMCIPVEFQDVKSFTREYNPELKTQRCIADKRMLLEYMVRTERTYNITMSFPAYGVDPIVFDEVLAELSEQAAQDGDGNAASTPPVVSINVAGRQGNEEGKEPTEIYEKIEVDGVLYLSCVSECLDKEYLHKVIAEATEAVYMHGGYVYTMVGPRPLTPNGEVKGEFIETLKLNSYELSVLLCYMEKIEGVKVQHGTFDGRSAISFQR